MLKFAIVSALLISGIANAEARELFHGCALDTCNSSGCVTQEIDICRVQHNRRPEPAFQLTQSTLERDAATALAPPPSLDSLQSLFAALRACWRPPSRSIARADMEITVRISFKRSGALFGAPRVTFATPGISADVRDLYRTAVADSLATCTPFTFSAAFGDAVAGRPIVVRYMDNRIKVRHAQRLHRVSLQPPAVSG